MNASSPTPKAKLIGRMLPVLDMEIELDEAECRLGRNPKWATTLLADCSISKSHAIISFNQQGSWSIVDLGSSNGSSVNGVALVPNQGVLLTSGDKIRIGRTEFLFSIVDNTSATSSDFGKDMSNMTMAATDVTALRALLNGVKQKEEVVEKIEETSMSCGSKAVPADVFRPLDRPPTLGGVGYRIAKTVIFIVMICAVIGGILHMSSQSNEGRQAAIRINKELLRLVDNRFYDQVAMDKLREDTSKSLQLYPQERTLPELLAKLHVLTFVDEMKRDLDSDNKSSAMRRIKELELFLDGLPIPLDSPSGTISMVEQIRQDLLPLCKDVLPFLFFLRENSLSPRQSSIAPPEELILEMAERIQVLKQGNQKCSSHLMLWCRSLNQTVRYALNEGVPLVLEWKEFYRQYRAALRSEGGVMALQKSYPKLDMLKETK